MYSVLSIDSPNYGWIISTHRTREVAQQKIEKLCRAVRRRTPNALTHLMFEIAEVTRDEIRNGRARRR